MTAEDVIKSTLLGMNPILLVVILVVSVLHTVLEFLAFKNDIQFWQKKKSMRGLSVRTVLFNAFQSLVVFLYICDNQTPSLIKFSTGVAFLVELWKIPKCMDIEVDYNDCILGVVPKVRFSDKGTYVESDTKVYDEMAFKYLSMVLFPLLACYAGYSLFNEESGRIYSWLLRTLYEFLLAFGFIMMTPQLFINYKLQSVAHMPWRMLTYKFINTIIDDLFAFAYKMPTMHRIACFRDDIVFLVYLYQSWIYRVDPKRVNEFGTSLENPTGIQEDDQQLGIAAGEDENTNAQTTEGDDRKNARVAGKVVDTNARAVIAVSETKKKK